MSLRLKRVLAPLALASASGALSGCSILDLFRTKSDESTVIWHVSGRGVSTPAYDGETAYFLGSDHSVLALRGDDGKQLWVGHAYDLPGVAFGYGGCSIAASLVVCNDSDLVAFRRVDGSRAWIFHPTVGRFPGYAGFVVSGTSIFAGSPTGVVYGIDAATGEQRWAQTVLNTGNSNATGLSTDGQRVFVAFTHFVTPQRGGVIALDATTGAVQWTTDYPRPAPDSTTGGVSTAVWNDAVFGSSTDGRIYALDRASGAVLWELPGVGKAVDTNRPFGPDLRGITISDNTLVATSLSAWVVGYDLTMHREKWRVDVRSSGTSFSPQVGDESAYTIQADGRLAAASMSGRLRWLRGDFAGGYVGAPAVASNRLFVSGKTGFSAVAQ